MAPRVSIDRYEEGVVGLPEDGQFIPLTNSSASKLTCLRRWWFDDVEGLKRPMEGGAIERGTSWDTITEDMYRWWEATDSPYPESALDRCIWCKGAGATPDGGECAMCQGTGDGSLVRALEPWWLALEQDPPPFGSDTVEQEDERLRLAFRGYVERFQAKPLQHFRIVGVQAKLARAILNPDTGKPYRPDTYLVRTEVGWVRAGTAAAVAAKASGGEIRKVNWPVYQVGALDAVARDRSNGQGWVIDAKFTGAMNSFNERLQVDPQLPGYCWLLSANLDHFGLTGVAGMMYDLTNSRLHGRPYELKWKPPLIGEMKERALERGLDVKGVKGVEEYMTLLGLTEGHGGFSTSESKLAGVPSWILRDAVEHAAVRHPSDVQVDAYDEAIAWCEANVDPGLYSRPWRSFTEDDLARYEAEVFGKAKVVSGLHRAAVRVRSPVDIDVSFPRTPVCSMPGGSCPYRGPCMADAPEVREQFTQRPLVVWKDEETVVDNPPDFQKELGF